MKNLIADWEVAFGNGTRPSGFELASVEFNGENTPYDLHREVRNNKPLDELESASVTLNDGVEYIELKNALANPNHVRWQDDDEQPAEPLEPGDWRNIEVGDAVTWSKDIKSKLTDAGLDTLGDVEAYVNENEGLESISGLGPIQQETVLDTLSLHLETNIEVEL